MGYYAHSNESDILILKDRQKALIEHVKEYYDEDTRIQATKDIPDLFIEFGLAAESSENGDIDAVWFEYQKFHSTELETFLNVIAPYVEPGSYITFCGEDDCLWAYYFDGLGYKEYGGHIEFPGMPMEGPKRKGEMTA